jgi:fatty acid amide hydrolase
VARLRAVGAIVLGKTNAAQLLLFVETDNPIHGRTNNPWNLERSSGGSSGGEGAIIAAGGSPLGIGTDIGGSVRIPAAFCGITAMRPTAGRAPDLGRFSVPIGQRGLQSQIGPLARHVEDVALCLTLMAGARDPQIEPPVPLGDFRKVDVAGLRVAVFSDDGLLTPAPGARRAVREAAEMLTKAGAKVTAWQPPSIATAWSIFFWCVAGDKGRTMRRLLRGQKTDPRLAILKLAGMPRLPLALLRGLLRIGGQRRMAHTLELFGYNGETEHYWKTLERQFDFRQEWRRSLDSAAGGPFDVMLCPAFGVPAVRHGTTQNLPLAGAYSVLPVVLGYPAGIVPVSRVRPDEGTDRPQSRDIIERTARDSELGSAGLPVAVQVIARPWQEHVALAVMQAIEDAARQRPDYPTSPPI